ARENRQRIGALAAERLPEGRGVACPNVARGRRPARCRSRARGGVRQVRAPRARCGHARCSDGRHMLTTPLSMMRRRVGGLVRATVLSLLVLAPPYVAAEIAPLYLRWDHHLVIAAPTSIEPRDDVSVSVGAGQQAVLGEFRSDP